MKTDTGTSPESGVDTVEPQARLAWEAARIAEADAELAAGLYVDAGEMRAWVESLRTTEPLPPPPTRHR